MKNPIRSGIAIPQKRLDSEIGSKSDKCDESLFSRNGSDSNPSLMLSSSRRTLSQKNISVFGICVAVYVIFSLTMIVHLHFSLRTQKAKTGAIVAFLETKFPGQTLNLSYSDGLTPIQYIFRAISFVVVPVASAVVFVVGKLLKGVLAICVLSGIAYTMIQKTKITPSKLLQACESRDPFSSTRSNLEPYAMG